MAISIGDTLPEANFLKLGSDGPVDISVATLTDKQKVVFFAVPGAFTPTCSSAHVPSFVRNAEALKDKGITRIICISVNDPFVIKTWGEATGASAAGIEMLSDADGNFTKALGLNFSALPAGLINRSRRYAMVVDKGVVTHLNLEESPGVCELSAAETLLDQL